MIEVKAADLAAAAAFVARHSGECRLVGEGGVLTLRSSETKKEAYRPTGSYVNEYRDVTVDRYEADVTGEGDLDPVTVSGRTLAHIAGRIPGELVRVSRDGGRVRIESTDGRAWMDSDRSGAEEPEEVTLTRSGTVSRERIADALPDVRGVTALTVSATRDGLGLSARADGVGVVMVVSVDWSSSATVPDVHVGAVDRSTLERLVTSPGPSAVNGDRVEVEVASDDCGLVMFRYGGRRWSHRSYDYVDGETLQVFTDDPGGVRGILDPRELADAAAFALAPDRHGYCSHGDIDLTIGPRSLTVSGDVGAWIERDAFADWSGPVTRRRVKEADLLDAVRPFLDLDEVRVELGTDGRLLFTSGETWTRAYVRTTAAP